MMHQMIVVALFVCGVELACSQPAKMPEKASTRLDPMHLDQVLSDAKMRDNYVRCFMEKGVCTPEATEIKHILPAALNDNCAKCSKVQKAGSGKVIQFLMDEQPDIWKQVSAKYDPKGLHKKWFSPTPKDKKTAANKGAAAAKSNNNSSNEKDDSKGQ